jgi:hypothetical protein
MSLIRVRGFSIMFWQEVVFLVVNAILFYLMPVAQRLHTKNAQVVHNLEVVGNLGALHYTSIC